MTTTFTKISITAVILTVVLGVFGFFNNSDTFINHADAATGCGDCGTGGNTTGGGNTQGGGSSTNPPICNITVNITKAAAGQSFTVSWNGTPSNADFKINGGAVLDSDSYTTTFNGSYDYMRYVLYGQNSDGECSKEVVIYKDVPVPVCNVNLNVTSVTNVGDPYTITWNGTPSEGTYKMNGTVVADAGSVTKTFVGPHSDSFTFSGVNGTYTCSKTVIVSVQPTSTPAPTCTLTATPTSIVSGSSSRLKWTYTNAVSGSIDQGIGTIVLTNAAGRTVTPTGTGDKTYTMTVTNSVGVTAICDATVTVTTPNPVAPTCDYFRANPLTINRGEATLLSWASTRANSASINNGVGPVAVDGTYSVSPLENITYTLSLVGVGGTTQCTVPVHVTQPHTNISCAQNVHFYADNSSIAYGNSTALHWNTNGVSNVSITDFGSVSVDGSQTISPSSDRTYTLNASNGSDSISCPITVSVTTESHHYSSSPITPRCTIRASDTAVSLGERTTLTWNSTNAFDLTLKDSEGKTLITTENRSSSDKNNLFDGELTLRPEKDTTYTMEVVRGSRTDTCDVHVSVARVVVSQIRDQQPLVSGIALTNVPYTGFEAGPIMTLFFYSLLALWALYLAYVLVVRRGTLTLATVAAPALHPAAEHFNAKDVLGVFTPAAVVTPAFHQSVVATTVAATTATVGYAATVTDAVATEIENHAHAAKVLLSSDAVATFVTATAAAERLTILDTLLATAKENYPTEDGWVILGEERMKTLLTA